MSSTATISLRTQLKGTIDDFLEAVGMECRATAVMLTELAFLLAHYTEEGVDLHPKIVILDDKSKTLRILQCQNITRIGQASKDQNGIRKALKKCAPLARCGWTIYVERKSDTIEYGVFCEPAPTALDLRDTISGLSIPDASAILVFQAAPKVVELLGAEANRVYAHLSGVREDQPYEIDEIERLATACCLHMSGYTEIEKSAARSFMRTSLFTSIREGHGCLIAVVSELPTELSGDATILDTPIDIAPTLREYTRDMRADSTHSLSAFQSLMSGMLNCDGITILGSNCQIVGYNAFIRVPPPEAPSAAIGGARRRAFTALETLLNERKITAAFFRSSDGRVMLKEVEHNG